MCVVIKIVKLAYSGFMQLNFFSETEAIKYILNCLKIDGGLNFFVNPF